MFKKAQLAENRELCGKKLGFLKLPKKEQNLDKTPKNYVFSTKKPKKNHFSCQLQVLCDQKLAQFLAVPNLYFFV